MHTSAAGFPVRAGVSIFALGVLLAGCGGGGTPTSVPSPSPGLGRVIYRAAKVAGFESLGVTELKCRHRDPVTRSFQVEFFDPAGGKVVYFGVARSPAVGPGVRAVFVTDGTYFHGDEIDVKLGHLPQGTARISSDAKKVRCVGRIRMDPGARHPSWYEDVGLVREGRPLPDLGHGWPAPSSSPKH